MTNEELVESYENKIRAKIQSQKEVIMKRYEGFHAHFTEIQRQREVSVFKQFLAIFVRNWYYLARNPRVL